MTKLIWNQIEKDIYNKKYCFYACSQKITTLEKGQQSIKNLVLNVEAKNAQRHLKIMNKLSQDIEFIKHKELKNEEDIFYLKRNIEIAK